MNLMAPQLVNAIGWSLLDFVWQGAAIGCATALLLSIMRQARPGLRYLVACAGLLLCAAWPTFELFHRLVGANAGLLETMRAEHIIIGTAVQSSSSLQRMLQQHLSWIVAGWAACALALALRLGLGLAWVQRIERNTPAPDPAWQARIERMAAQFGITRSVRMRIVADLASPITAGWWRPVVLMPAALMSGMPQELLEALAAHELAHIRHHDYLVNLLQNVIETVLFYHPAVWWISGQIRIEREQMADDFAARQLGEPRRLALALSELERFQFSHHHLAQAANGGHLMSRIKRLVQSDTAVSNWKAAIPVLVLAVMTIGGSASAGGRHEADNPELGIYHRAMADFSSCAKPIWPADSLRNGETGTVHLAFEIDELGNVVDSKVMRSSGHIPLDEAAQDGIKLCKFKPAQKDGHPLREWMRMQYVWTLE
jgi:bla regulator protein BlaR1